MPKLMLLLTELWTTFIFNTFADIVLALLYAKELKDIACSQAFQDTWR